MNPYAPSEIDKEIVACADWVPLHMRVVIGLTASGCEKVSGGYFHEYWWIFFAMLLK